MISNVYIVFMWDMRWYQVYTSWWIWIKCIHMKCIHRVEYACIYIHIYTHIKSTYYITHTIFYMCSMYLYSTCYTYHILHVQYALFYMCNPPPDDKRPSLFAFFLVSDFETNKNGTHLKTRLFATSAFLRQVWSEKP